MIVKCLIDKGEITKEECLECAMDAVLPACGLEYSYLYAMYASMGDGERDNEIHVSDIVHCLRKSVLDKRFKIAESAADMSARFKGIAMHDFMEGKNTWASAEVPIDFEGVLGRTDLVYQNKRGEWIMVDYKTAKKISFDRLPYGEHESQLNLYAWLLEQLGHAPIDRLILVYINNNGPTECSGKICKKAKIEYVLGELACPICGRTPKDAHFGAKAIEVPKQPARDIARMFRDRKMALEKAMHDGSLPAGEPSWLCDRKFCKHDCDFRYQDEE